jgi:hypothetical protein
MREFHLDTRRADRRLRLPSGDRRGRRRCRADASRQMRELATKGAVHLIADRGQVDFFDSTGLGALVGGLKRLREAGGSLPLVTGPIKTAACIRRTSPFASSAMNSMKPKSPRSAARLPGTGGTGALNTGSYGSSQIRTNVWTKMSNASVGRPCIWRRARCSSHGRQLTRPGGTPGGRPPTACRR